MSEKVTKENLNEKIASLNSCNNCKDIQIKKFQPIVEFEDYDILDGEYMKCSCGKRPIDVVMAHILKIMIEEGDVNQKATLRRNSPIPLSTIFYSSLNPQFLGSDSIILIHNDFSQNSADRLINEVREVKGVIKGNPAETFDNNFQLLTGDDLRCDILRTLIKNNDELEKIIINKKQAEVHIEVAPTTEEKLVKLYNYLKNNEINKKTAIDAMCGTGSIGIFLKKYGFEKVIFNDINPNAIKCCRDNIQTNEVEDGFEVHNEDFMDLNIDKADLIVIDSYPGMDISEIENKAKKISENILII